MTQKQDTVVGNQAIHEFVGKSKFPENPTPNNAVWYNQDWNLLMGVVDKIEKMNFLFVIGTSFVSIEWPGVIGEVEGLNADPGIYIYINSPLATHAKSDAESKHNAVWKAVVQFIHWYNNQ